MRLKTEIALISSADVDASMPDLERPAHEMVCPQAVASI